MPRRAAASIARPSASPCGRGAAATCAPSFRGWWRIFKLPTLRRSGPDADVLWSVVEQARDFANQAARASRQYLRQALAPAAGETGPLRGFPLDVLRSKRELLAENA